MYQEPEILVSSYPENDEEIRQIFFELTGVAKNRIHVENGQEWRDEDPPVLIIGLEVLMSDELPYGFVVEGDIKILNKDTWLMIASREISNRWKVTTFTILSEKNGLAEIVFKEGQAFRCEPQYFSKTGGIRILGKFEAKIEE